MIERPRRRPPTLADIAARAGTTVPTVSKVLNGRSDVSAATRDQIMQIVADTGYRRSRRSRVRPGGDQRLVDLVLTGVAGSWANQVLIGVESAATDAGLDLVVTVARDPMPARSDSGDWVARLLARASQGAVLAMVRAGEEQLATLQAAEVPVVLLDPVQQPPESLASVGTTNWSAGHDVAEHLAGLGHRRLGVLAGRSDQLYNRARVDGFSSAVRQHPGLHCDVTFTDGSHHAARAAAEMLDRPDRPTAVFGCTDQLALGVLQAAAERGIGVPEQLSVVGFDDLPEARWAGLTTVRQPIAEMGAAALRMLLRLRAEHPVPREELATSLVVRDSTGSAPRSA